VWLTARYFARGAPYIRMRGSRVRKHAPPGFYIKGSGPSVVVAISKRDDLNGDSSRREKQRSFRSTEQLIPLIRCLLVCLTKNPLRFVLGGVMLVGGIAAIVASFRLRSSPAAPAT
jgi:hypothetical protein